MSTAEISFNFQDTDYCIKDFALSDEKATHNLLQLFNRKKGTLLRVDNGHLVEIKTIRERFSYHWNKTQQRPKLSNNVQEEAQLNTVTTEQEALAQVIKQTLAQFQDFLTDFEDKKVAEAAVKYLFNKKGQYGIGRLSKKLFNRKMLKCDNLFSQYLAPPHTVRIKFSDTQFADITNEEFSQNNIPFALEWNLGEEILNDNLWMLLKRKKGQIYHVNAEGRLQKVKNHWEYYEGKNEIERKVQEAVTGVIKGINAHLAAHTATAVHKLVINQIFSPNTSLCRMNRAVFDRSSIEENASLEILLKEDFGTFRKKLVDTLMKWQTAIKQGGEAEICEAKRSVEGALLNLNLEEFRFVQKLGVDLERNKDGGSGGARYARDRYGRKILVIKPKDEGPLGVNNPMWYAKLKRLIVSPKPCLEGISEPMSEVDSYLWDRRFNIWSVPPTEVRNISSKKFVKHSFKECSVQMFVSDCQTIGKYVSVSPRVQWLPRCFLRWYCGSRYNSSFFYSVGQKKGRETELLKKLPQHCIERVAIHNYGIEDIDCHFENILVKIFEAAPDTLIERLLKKDETANREEVESWVNQFFTADGNQKLLQQLLYSEEVEVNGAQRRISLIKHDGGASNPRSHPSWWDFLSLRYKHLFEVLPHFEKLFTDKGKEIIQNKQEIFIQFLLEKGMRNLKNVAEKGVFDAFYAKEENRALLKKWILTTDQDKELPVRLQLMGQLLECTRSVLNKRNEKKLRTNKYYLFYFNQHLIRIWNSLQTRIDSFRVLHYHIGENSHDMRYIFKNIKCKEEFKSELAELVDSFNATMKTQRKQSVKPGDLSAGSTSLLDTNDILGGFFL